MHADKNTLCMLRFLHPSKKWKDECGRIFYTVPNDDGIYPKLSHKNRWNGLYSYAIETEAYIKFDNLDIDLNQLDEWTIDFWVYIPATVDDAEVMRLFIIKMYGTSILIDTTSASFKFIDGRRSIQCVKYEDMVGRFIHRAIVKDVNEIRSYYDGNLLMTIVLGNVEGASNALISYSNQSLSIGGDSQIEYDDSYVCYIDDFRISNIARYNGYYYDPMLEKDHEFALARFLEYEYKFDVVRNQVVKIEQKDEVTERYIRGIINVTHYFPRSVERNYEIPSYGIRDVQHTYNLIHYTLKNIDYTFDNEKETQRNIERTDTPANNIVRDVQRIFNPNNFTLRDIQYTYDLENFTIRNSQYTYKPNYFTLRYVEPVYESYISTCKNIQHIYYPDKSTFRNIQYTYTQHFDSVRKFRSVEEYLNNTTRDIYHTYETNTKTIRELMHDYIYNTCRMVYKDIYFTTERRLESKIYFDTYCNSLFDKYSKDGIIFDTQFNYHLLLYSVDPKDPNYDPSKENRPIVRVYRLIERKYKDIPILTIPVYREIIYISKGYILHNTLRNLLMSSIDKDGNKRLPIIDIQRLISKHLIIKFDTYGYYGDNIELEIHTDLVQNVVSSVSSRKNAYKRSIYREIVYHKKFKFYTYRDVQSDSILYQRDYNMGRNVVAFVFNPEYTLLPEYANVPYVPPKYD